MFSTKKGLLAEERQAIDFLLEDPPTRRHPLSNHVVGTSLEVVTSENYGIFETTVSLTYHYTVVVFAKIRHRLESKPITSRVGIHLILNVAGYRFSPTTKNRISSGLSLVGLPGNIYNIKGVTYVSFRDYNMKPGNIPPMTDKLHLSDVTDVLPTEPDLLLLDRNGLVFHNDMSFEGNEILGVSLKGQPDIYVFLHRNCHS